jgi:hypothetical protein
MNTNNLTTILGAIVAVITAAQPLIATGKINWFNVLAAAAIALFGYLTNNKVGDSQPPILK